MIFVTCLSLVFGLVLFIHQWAGGQPARRDQEQSISTSLLRDRQVCAIAPNTTCHLLHPSACTAPLQASQLILPSTYGLHQSSLSFPSLTQVPLLLLIILCRPAGAFSSPRHHTRKTRPPASILPSTHNHAPILLRLLPDVPYARLGPGEEAAQSRVEAPGECEDVLRAVHGRLGSLSR